MALPNLTCIALKRSSILQMSAPKVCYSSLALLMRETCASATPSVTVSKTNTTLDCSRMNGRGLCKHSYSQQASCFYNYIHQVVESYQSAPFCIYKGSCDLPLVDHRRAMSRGSAGNHSVNNVPSSSSPTTLDEHEQREDRGAAMFPCIFCHF